MAPAPTTVEVTFSVWLERVGHFDHPFSGYGDIEVERQLRAEVTFRGVNDEPTVDRLEKAEWERLSADEQVMGEESAIDAAVAKLRAQMARAS